MVEKGEKYRKLEDEEWRAVPGSNNLYWVSSYGRVKSFVIYKDKGRIIKNSVVKNFKFIQLKYNNRINRFFIHKLVAEVWLGKPSEKHTIVTHIDRNLNNNHYTNLQWLTPEEAGKRNGEHFKKLFTGKTHPGERHNCKLKVSDVIQLKKMLQLGTPQSKIAKMFCISEMQVTRIKRGENWGDVKISEKE